MEMGQLERHILVYTKCAVDNDDGKIRCYKTIFGCKMVSFNVCVCVCARLYTGLRYKRVQLIQNVH